MQYVQAYFLVSFLRWCGRDYTILFLYSFLMLTQKFTQLDLTLLVVIMRHLATIISSQMGYQLRTPIDLDRLKTPQGQQQLRQSVRARYKPDHLVDTLLKHHLRYRKTLFNAEGINREVNSLKQRIKEKVMAKEPKEELVNELREIKKQQTDIQVELREAALDLEAMTSKIGNLVDPRVTVSKNQEENRVIKQSQMEAKLKQSDKSGVRSYEWLTEKFGIADLGRGQKVAGHRGYFLSRNGLKLSLALTNFGIEHLEQHGYRVYQTPAMILESVLRESCQLLDIDKEVYQIQGQPLCLIATSQQTLAGFHRNETIEKSKLPLRMGGYSTCFRKEAGAHGKDIHGLFRVHQFEKLEQFVLTTPANSDQEMERMVQVSESFYQALGIPYRLVEIVSGALNDTAFRKIDLEAWYPSQGRFRQLVSVSNCTDYQARLLNTYYREGKITQPVHMLNGTLVAIQRTLTCLLEHCYDPSLKSLCIPSALQPYLRMKTLEPL